MIPQYLRHISTEEKVWGGRTTFSIACGCSNDRFDVLVNGLTQEEKKQLEDHRKASETINRRCWAMKSTVDRDGVVHHWKYLAPFVRVEVFPPEEPPFDGIMCWQLRCSACGQEHLIFDNRVHGYDGVFCAENTDRDYQPVFKQRSFRDKLPRRIEITTENEKTIEDLREATGIDCDADTWSNAFSWIGVCAVDSRGKRTRILEAETA